MKRLITGIGCALLIGCAPPTQFLKKTYAPSALDNQRVLVYPIYANQVSVANEEDFADDFEEVKEAPGQFLSRELGDNAAAYFGKYFHRVELENAVDSNLAPLTSANSQKLSEKIGEDEFEIRIPNSEYLNSQGLHPKFVLVFDQIVFSRNLKTSQTPMAPAPAPMPGQASAAPGMMMTTSQKSLGLGINYLLYDYEEKAVAGYGYAEGEKKFSFAMTHSDWYAVMDKTFEKIKAYTPFK